MLSYQHIPYIATGVFVLLMSILAIYAIRVFLKDSRIERNFDKQLKFTINPIVDDVEEEKESSLEKKMRALPKMMIEAEIVDKKSSIEDIQKKLLLMGSLLFTGTALISKNMFAGMVLVILGYISLTILSMFKVGRTKNLMEEQIPSFVSTFKANIQANQHPQNAMIRAIDNTASPLYDELAYAKAVMEAGDFRPGIIHIRKNTTNDTLRQMASCIELASSTGSNIEQQLEIIEEIIKDKQDIERKKRLGINENKPLFLISALFVPVSFVGSYAMSDMHRDFWFNSTLSWILLLGIIVIMAISAYATWKVIQKVDKV